MTKIKVFLFDLGGVLIGWDPLRIYNKLIPDPKERDAFMPIFHACNARTNRCSWTELLPCLSKEYPAYKELLAAYPAHYPESLSGVIQGTVSILKELKAKGYRTYAASNWDADTFEMVRANLPFVPYFDGLQISGDVGLVKPDADFFELMMKDFDFKAEEALFIDDLSENVEAARKLGIKGILFRDSDQLRRDLTPYL